MKSRYSMHCSVKLAVLVRLAICSLACAGMLPGSNSHAQGFSPLDAVKRMTVPEGLTVTLFASEPDVRQPIFCKCDDRGRLWTIQYLQYPNPAGLERVKVDRYSRTVYDRKPEPPPHGPRGADRITILEDSDGDGRADSIRDFVAGLNLCTGVEFGFGGVFVIQAPYLLFYPDRDHDDQPDSDPEVLLDGFGMEDAQSLANHLTWGPDGWLYGLNGSTTTSRIRGIEFQQGVWRYHPVTRDFELFCEGGGNIYGLTFDRFGRLFYSSNGGLFYHGVQGGYYEKNFGKHGPLHNPYAYGYFSHVKSQGQTGRPNPGATIYLGDSFPKRFHDSFLVSDFLAHTCSWWKVEPTGSTVEARLGGHLLESHDTWFGATDLCLGPDGAVYVCDFYDARTAHPDPDAKWDDSNGRIYRLQAANSAVGSTVDIGSMTGQELVELLKHANRWFSQRARRRIAEVHDVSITPALRAMATQAMNEEWALQAVWALHTTGSFDADIASRCLEHPSEHVRAWTVRLLADANSITAAQAQQLVRVAQHDSSVIVRAQLAASARRIPCHQALPILMELFERDLAMADPFVPWLLWWGLESKAISDRAEVVEKLAKESRWHSKLAPDNLRRLIRRYAAEGTEPTLHACARFWDTAPVAELPSVVQALYLGLRERSRELASGPVPEPLRERIAAYWRDAPDDPQRMRLALEARLDNAYPHLVSRLASVESDSERELVLKILADYGREDCVEIVLPLVRSSSPLSVRRESFQVLQRFVNTRVASELLTAYPTMPETLRHQARALLLSQRHSAQVFLRAIDANIIPAAEVSIHQLRPLAVFNDEELDGLVRKHWGRLTSATPEERLADVRRFQNDLNAGQGLPNAGKPLFEKHCANCHKLRSAGNNIGPDLTSTVTGDLTSLLVNVVDPNAVVRREYLNYVLSTRNGSVHTGLLAEQDAASITLLDARNQRVRVSRDEIEDLKESTQSLMPEKLLEPLTPQELRDLFAFMRTLP